MKQTSGLAIMRTVFVGGCCLLVLLLVGRASADARQDSLRSAVAKMLDISPPAGAVSRPPQHILQLYQKFASSKRLPANTVRSIEPLHEPESQLLLFDLSSVRAGEDLRAAQLHVHRRRLPPPPLHRRALAPPLRVRLYAVAAGRRRASLLASVSVPVAARAGWHALDVSAALRELLLSDAPAPLLGVRFRAPGGRALSPAAFLKGTNASATPAFLVLFSDDGPDNYIYDDDPRPAHTHAMAELLASDGLLPPPRSNANATDIPVPKVDSGKGNFKFNVYDPPRDTSSEESFEDGDADDDEDDIEDRPLPRKRWSRSILDNELPGMESEPPDQAVAKVHAKFATLPPFISGPQHKKLNKKKKGKGKKHRKNKKASDKPGAGGGGGSCSRHSMTVDFKELGWEDWIIAPPSFDAYYCAGSCNFPLPNVLRPTNHAVLQSFLHEVGQQGGVPAPCCVPDHLDDVYLLYLESSGVVVLRIYSNITVKTCACR